MPAARRTCLPWTASRRPPWPAILVAALTHAAGVVRAQNTISISSMGTTMDSHPLFRLGSGAVLGDGPLLDAAAGTHLGDLCPAFGQRDGHLPDAAAEAYLGTLRPTFEGGNGFGHPSAAIAVFTLPAPTAEST